MQRAAIPTAAPSALRLSRKVTVNSIEAADKFFVDLLPETWSGPPPPLPHEVVEELAKRAREVDHLQHLAQLAEQRRKAVPVRVHVASHPTFTRYVFDVPEHISVSADRAKERLTLSFDSPLTFDMVEVETDLAAGGGLGQRRDRAGFELGPLQLHGAGRSADIPRWQGYVVDIVKDEASTPARNKALGKPMPLVNGNMEAMPQTTVTAESMTVTPPPRASAAAPAQASARESPCRAADASRRGRAAGQQVPESTIVVQSDAPPSTPKPKESESSTEYTPMAGLRLAEALPRKPKPQRTIQAATEARGGSGSEGRSGGESGGRGKSCS